MATRRESRRDRKRAGSASRDAKHRLGGDWTTLRIPDGVDLFQPKEGSVRFDIVPYIVGEGNPYAEKGEEYYERTYYQHDNVGVNKERYVCPNKTSGLPCPICEMRANMQRDPDSNEKIARSLKPKERQLFLVHVVGDEDGLAVKLYESSFHTFGKLLDKRRQDAEKDEPHISDFDDPEAGATLKVNYQETNAEGFKFTDAYSIDFKARPKGLDPELLEHGYCLDDMIVILSYDELKAKFLQEGGGMSDSDEEEDDPKPKKKGKAPVKDVEKEAEEAWGDDGEDDDDDEDKSNPAEEAGLKEGMTVRHRKSGICKILRISSDGTSLTLEDEDGEKIRAVDPKDVRIEEEKKKETPVKKAPPKKADKPKKEDKEEESDEDADDDWGDEDFGEKREETKPAKKTATKKSPTKKAPPKDEDGDDDEDANWD